MDKTVTDVKIIAVNFKNKDVLRKDSDGSFSIEMTLPWLDVEYTFYFAPKNHLHSRLRAYTEISESQYNIRWRRKRKERIKTILS